MMVFQHLSERGRGFALSIAFSLLSGLLGCSVLVDSSREQCSTNLDCQIRGLEFAQAFCIDNLCEVDPTWACVDSASVPVQTATQAALQVTNLLDQTPFVGVRVSLYAALDISLGSPLSSANTDGEGKALLRVPAEFDGFALVEQADVIEPAIFYPTLPITEESGLGVVYAGKPGSSAGLVSLLGQVPQTGRGIALMGVRDCNSTGGNGASFEFQGETQGSTPFYAFNGVASSSARALDKTGQAGIVNVRPGVIGMELQWGDKTVSSASVLVRADTVTQLMLLPGRSSAGVANVIGAAR